ncbi:uncharacterized protein BJ171DRAFT_32048, partial [Polychytrium aggregatum]|uniref:uncharacterized protein n=1 Tax=Polychytrium aggregatum TaxID=110093 RepID=UPI0022FEF498
EHNTNDTNDTKDAKDAKDATDVNDVKHLPATVTPSLSRDDPLRFTFEARALADRRIGLPPRTARPAPPWPPHPRCSPPGGINTVLVASVSRRPSAIHPFNNTIQALLFAQCPLPIAPRSLIFCTMHNHYLVGLDLSDCAQEPAIYTIEWISDHLLSEGDQITIASVLPNIDSPEVQEAEESTTRRVKVLLESLEAQYAKKKVRVESTILHSSQEPGLALCEMAAEIKATNLVLGYDPHKSSHSIGNYCLDNSEVPVSIIRPVYHYK